VFLTVALLGCHEAAADSEKPLAPHEQLVREFIQAFNTRDLGALLERADEEIEWQSFDGASVAVEARGKAALRASLERYFSDCPTCQSALEWVASTSSRVVALERVSWTGNGGPRAQSSLSVYEFRGGKILRVLYFPAEPTATVPPP